MPYVEPALATAVARMICIIMLVTSEPAGGLPERCNGIGLTPDEREVWVVDAANQRVHAFDNTVMPRKQGASITLPVRNGDPFGVGRKR